ncbi:MULTISPECIES: ATP-binding protein [Streptomyces]|uniref:ATP-binding protein n=1 Tax=Streptomyces TaxID=1883 RepID=UPI0033306270
MADELTRLGRTPLIVVDEIGYIPFDPEAANLFLQFISAALQTRVRDRHEQQALRTLG